MRQYQVKTGQVSVLANDVNALQDAVLSNIRTRLAMLIKRTGLKGGTDSEFAFSWRHLGGDRFQIDITGLGLILFPDLVVAPAEDRLTEVVTLSVGTQADIYITREAVYSNDQTGNFIPGHPVDETGALPTYGYNIEQSYRLALQINVGVLTASKGILIGSVIRTDLITLSFTDLRTEHSIMLNSDGFLLDSQLAVANLSVESVYQSSLMTEEEESGTPVNILSPLTNQNMNRLYLAISWDRLEEAYAYEIRLITMDEEEVIQGYPESFWVPAAGVEAVCRTYIEASQGVYYKVGVRAVISSPSHDVSPWTFVTTLAGATKQMEGRTDSIPIGGWNPIPKPDFSVTVLQGMDGDRKPCLLRFEISPDGQTPVPHFAQVFASDSAPTDAPLGHLVYEGPVGESLYTAAPGDSFFYSARIVGPGGVCSGMKAFAERITAPLQVWDPEMSTEIQLVFPIKHTLSPTGQIPMNYLRLYAPGGPVRVKAMRFQGYGTYINSGPGTQNDLKMQIGLASPGSLIQPRTRGKELAFPEYITLNTVPVSGTAPTLAAEYQQAVAMKEISNARIFTGGTELHVLLTAHSWDSGSSPGIHFAGDLFIILERFTGEAIQV